MENSKQLVVYTCIVKDYDTLREVPARIFDAVSSTVSFICFTDNPELYGNSKTWTIREIPEDLIKLDKVKAQRVLKIVPQRYVADEAPVSMWVDSNMEFMGSPLDILKSCDLKKFPIWTFKHPQRNCIYDEELAVVRLKKETKEKAQAQIEKYMKDKYPTKNGLAETNVIVRRHDDLPLKRMSYMWAKEVIDNSHRDQLSFNYCCWKTGLKYGELNTQITRKVFIRKNHIAPSKLKEDAERRREEEYRRKLDEEKQRVYEERKKLEEEKKEFAEKKKKLEEEEEKKKIENSIVQVPENKEEIPQENYDLIVSFTTHKPRLEDKNNYIESMLNSILSQKTSVKFKIVLTLFEKDVRYLKKNLKSFLEKNNIEILVVDKNLKPHLKYFYTCQKYRELPVLTVDDDCIYEDTLIEDLYNAYKENPGVVLTKRVHLITYDDMGRAKSYSNWEKESNILTPSFDLIATGVGGVLYPPDILRLSDDNLPEISLSLTNDDIYLRKLETDLGVRVQYIPPKNGVSSYTLMESAMAVSPLCISVNRENNDKIINILNIRRTQTTVDVCMITDKNYLNCTLTCINSIKVNRSPKNTYRIHVICDSVSNENQSKIKSLSENNFFVDTIPDPEIDYNIEKFRMSVHHVSKAALYKFFIPRIFGNLNKILYIDGDVLVLGDIAELFELDLGLQQYAGVVRDYKVSTNTKPFFQRIVARNKGYFNSGVMLLNLYRMRKKNIEQQLIEYKMNKVNVFMDQDALNVVFNGHVRWLDVRYNFIAGYFSNNYYDIRNFYGPKIPLSPSFEELKKNVLIYHVAGTQKPWIDRSSIATEIYDKYAVKNEN